MSTDYAARGGLDFPVAPGDLWAVGPHRLLCGDVALGAAEVLLGEVVGAAPALCHTDPPWSPGAHGAFRARTGLAPLADFDGLVSAVLAASAFAPAVVVEMGWGSAEHLCGLAAGVGLRHCATWGTRHDGQWRALLGLVPAGSPELEWPGFEQGGPAPAVEAVRALTAPGELVVDFWAGLGATAAAAAAEGRVFAGTEVQVNRASATLAVLRRRCHCEPELVGRRATVAC